MPCKRGYFALFRRRRQPGAPGGDDGDPPIHVDLSALELQHEAEDEDDEDDDGVDFQV